MISPFHFTNVSDQKQNIGEICTSVRRFRPLRGCLLLKKKKITTYDFLCVICKPNKIHNSQPIKLIFGGKCSGKGVIWLLKWQHKLPIFASRRLLFWYLFYMKKKDFLKNNTAFYKFTIGKVHCASSM